MHIIDQTLANFRKILQREPSLPVTAAPHVPQAPLCKSYDPETALAGQTLCSDSSQTFLTRISSFTGYLRESVSSDNCLKLLGKIHAFHNWL